MEKIIELQGVGKDYQVGSQVVRALKSVTLTIERGEYVAIMGPSGSGKSTLMNILGGLDTPTRGQYTLNNRAVGDLNDKELAAIRNSEIGFVFQGFNLLPRATALENVMVPLIYAGKSKSMRLRKAMQVLTRVGLGDRVKHKPHELSGGQSQRVALARALVNTPSIILADEPTGNLDSSTSEEIMRLFDSVHQNGNTLIVVTHEQDIANYAQRIIRFRDGVVESDRINRR